VVTLADAAGPAQPLFVEFVNTLHWYEGGPVELLGDDGASPRVAFALDDDREGGRSRSP
jgi:hypothetical protein